MVRVIRTGINNRIIKRNSKVYASTLNNGMMNGLFAYRDIEVGEILVQYTGPILTQKQANASSSDYLFDVFYRSREGADTVVRKTIDGRGELAGYANHAPEHLANASAVDLMPSIIDNDVYYEGRHALVFVAKSKIKRGTEIRFNYNSDQSNDSGEMVRMMKKRGVTEEQINNRNFLFKRYFTPPEHNWTGVVEPDFPYRFVSDIDKVPKSPWSVTDGGSDNDA